MKLGPFQEVILESSSVEELKEKVCLCYLTVQSLPHDLYCRLISSALKYKTAENAHQSSFTVISLCLISEFSSQLSEISNIPLENLEFAKVGAMQWLTQDASFSLCVALVSPLLNCSICLLCAGQRNVSL